MKILFILLFITFSAEAIQFPFLSMLLSSKKIKNFGTYRGYANGLYAKSCQEYKNALANGYTYHGDIGDGIYKIKPDSNPAINVYCDMTTDGGGWTLVNSNWIPSYASTVNSNNPALYSLGQFSYSVSPHPFTQMRLYCKSTARYIDRRRTTGVATTNLNIFADNSSSGTETRLAGDGDAIPGNWTGSWTEMHAFFAGDRRFIFRTDDIHCVDPYTAVGGEINNPRLGQEGRIFVK